ncbi:MAG: hypothetical protein J2P13_03760 [Acidobacteria bacterium]|nr:hypothetical protein [Acidobacteriota bacterium]
MARGWESKSIEQQQEERASPPKPRHKPLTADEIRQERERRGLELARRRISDELEIASHPRHRSMLEAALADLNRRLEAAARRPA